MASIQWSKYYKNYEILTHFDSLELKVHKFTLLEAFKNQSDAVKS